MNRTLILLLTIALLLITAHRLPAPIQEVPESPAPAPEQSAKPKTKRIVKPKASESAENPRKARIAAPSSDTIMPHGSLFDGTWTGTLNNVPFAGNIEYTLIIAGNGTSVTEKTANWGTKTVRATGDDTTVRWQPVDNCAWTLTPNSDGQTGLATINCSGFFGVGDYNGTPIFRRTSPSYQKQLNSGTASQPTARAPNEPTIPTAKPVPERPGFVYNPFDPTATHLLDVRGRPSGTRLKDPLSGKLFVVP